MRSAKPTITVSAPTVPRMIFGTSKSTIDLLVEVRGRGLARSIALQPATHAVVRDTTKMERKEIKTLLLNAMGDAGLEPATSSV